MLNAKTCIILTKYPVNIFFKRRKKLIQKWNNSYKKSWKCFWYQNRFPWLLGAQAEVNIGVGRRWGPREPWPLPKSEKNLLDIRVPLRFFRPKAGKNFRKNYLGTPFMISFGTSKINFLKMIFYYCIPIFKPFLDHFLWKF